MLVYSLSYSIINFSSSFKLDTSALNFKERSKSFTDLVSCYLRVSKSFFIVCIANLSASISEALAPLSFICTVFYVPLENLFKSISTDSISSTFLYSVSIFALTCSAPRSILLPDPSFPTPPPPAPLKSDKFSLCSESARRSSISF